MSSKAVFLDRDGVLNETAVVDGVPRPPATLSDLKILPGVVEACTILRTAGLTLAPIRFAAAHPTMYGSRRVTTKTTLRER